MDGRQPYFERFLVEVLASRWSSPEVGIDDLYAAASAEADPEWIDDELCPHGADQAEWKHELRRALQKMKAKGLATNPRRGVWRLT